MKLETPEAAKPQDNEEQQENRFFKEDNRWYFGTADEARFGPFDRVYEIEMGECFLGRWRGEQSEITGGDMARVLWLDSQPPIVEGAR